MILGGNVAVKSKLVHGVGINDANYKVTIEEEAPKVNGKQNRKTVWRCPFYSRWTEMLRRCFSKAEKLRHPTYKDVTCCEEWLTFSNFKSWMEQQDWEGKHLDKDLLVAHNKIYSPETCVFIAPSINSFLLKCDKTRGIYPIGVCYHKPKIINHLKHPYQAQIGDRGKLVYLGCYLTPEEAHKVWQKAKIKQAKILQSEQTDPKVIKGLQRVIDKIQNDYDNNLITEDF